MHAAGDDVQVRNKQAIAAGFESWRNGTGGIFGLLTPEASWTIVGNSPVSRTFTSRQEFLDVVISPFNARLSSRLMPTVRGIFADGDMVIALFDGEATALDGKPTGIRTPGICRCVTQGSPASSRSSTPSSSRISGRGSDPNEVRPHPRVLEGVRESCAMFKCSCSGMRGLYRSATLEPTRQTGCSSDRQ
jgi:ketosteroid isomerase-like protein